MNKKEVIEALYEVSDSLTEIKAALEELNEDSQFDYVTSPKLSDVNDLIFRLTHDIDRIVYQGK